MFNVNWNVFVAWLCPPVIRNAFWVNWFRVLINPLVTIHNSLLTFRTANLYQLSHTSQVWSIEAVLNNAFDPVERRIYLQDAGGYEVILLFPDSDQNPLLLSNDATAAVIIQSDSGYGGGAFDFVVVTPYQFTETDLYRLKALVNYYKLAGKRYDII